MVHSSLQLGIAVGDLTASGILNILSVSFIIGLVDFYYD